MCFSAKYPFFWSGVLCFSSLKYLNQDDDVAMLKKWKLYRINLKKLDTSDINVIFPIKPV
ncbi:tail fiber assembly protein [Gilliamella sp. A7]|uniref:tail fiber assembly protein n=1 Tax=Gilliamella sp. A7 TaxID=1970465 RepID=UPI00352A97DE